VTRPEFDDKLRELGFKLIREDVPDDPGDPTPMDRSNVQYTRQCPPPCGQFFEFILDGYEYREQVLDQWFKEIEPTIHRH
jgi:hypothetical protein